MKRRTLLASAGVGIASLTGCLFGGGGGDDSATPTTVAGSQPVRNVSRSSADLRLKSINASDSAPLNSPYNFELVVENTGDTAGVYRAPVSVQRTGTVEFRQEREALVYVEPGETQTAEITIPPFSEIGRVNVRLGGAANQWGVEVTERRLAFGGTFPNDGLSITVDRVELTESYQGPRGGNVEASDGQQWAFVWVRVRNTGPRAARSPNTREISFLHDGAEYSSYGYANRSPEYESEALQSGQESGGIIQYQVPASISKDDIAIRFEQRGARAVWLSPDGGGNGTDGSSGTGDSGQ
jgi:hypothetical protein